MQQRFTFPSSLEAARLSFEAMGELNLKTVFRTKFCEKKQILQKKKVIQTWDNARRETLLEAVQTSTQKQMLFLNFKPRNVTK